MTKKVRGKFLCRIFSVFLWSSGSLIPTSAAAITPGGGLRGPVVVYLIDTLRRDRVSVYGAPHPTTPAAERLSTEGIVFENAYSLSSWTRPSVGTLLTSRLPASIAAIGRYGVLDPAIPYLPEMLRKSGWATAAFVTNGNVFDLRLGFQRGFDTFQPIPGREHLGKAYAREAVEPALRFVRSRTSPNFFLYVHVVDPHDRPDPALGKNVYDLEPAYRDLFAGDTPQPSPGAGERTPPDYDRAVRQADDQFARLVAELKAKGFWDSALVFYTADHGEEFGEHGGWGHGKTLYEEQIRIPLVVKLPGGRQAGTRRRDLVSLADVVPTVASLLGLKPSGDWVGRSLLTPDASPTLYFSEDIDDVRLYGARRGSEKLIVTLYPHAKRTSFALDADPAEKAGVAVTAEAPGSAGSTSLFRLMEELRRREIDSCPTLRLEKEGEEALLIDLKANLSDFPKPFLTFEDALHAPSMTEGDALTIQKTLAAQEPFRLILSANAKGELPPYRLNVTSEKTDQVVDTNSPHSAFRVRKTVRPILQGPTSDEVLAHLKSLGYLRGP